MSKIIKLPGLIDAHVHLRDPGATHKEDFFTGSSAALAGGVVAIIDMPNNPNPTTSLVALAKKKQIAGRKSVCDYAFYIGADQKNWKNHKKHAKKCKGLKIYMNHTTGPLLVDSLEVLEKHFSAWPNTKPILVHAEDSTLASAIGLAYLYQKWLHICHVSKKSELDLIRLAKKNGTKITCEVAPHHLFLTKRDVKKLKGKVMMRPPLPSKEDQKALWQGIKNGLIDMIATDHAPHISEEKKAKHPPFGIPSLETRLPLLLTAINQKKISLAKLIMLTSTNPAKVFKINIKNCWVEVDMSKKWRINEKKLKSKCKWSPYHGWKVQGKVKKVYIRNKEVFANDKILVKKGFGKAL